ncbi:MAG: hypothetical protein GY941_17330 [Planctomycetes bacterium]|nr:hypothetical protein [Planctomycetota bacterium]
MSGSDFQFGIGFFGLFILLSVLVGIGKYIDTKRTKDRELAVYEKSIENHDLLKGQAAEIEKLKSKPYTKIYKYKNIENSTIITDVHLGSILNISEKSDDQLSDALFKLADEIAKSKNHEAAELFASFTSELESQNPKKSTLKSLWRSLGDTLPVIKNMVDITEKITKIFL